MKARVTFLDVGQGDCTVAVDLEVPAALVIDCPKSSLESLIQLLRDEGVASYNQMLWMSIPDKEAAYPPE